MDIILDYIRLVSYSLVAVISLVRYFFHRPVNRSILIGNAAMAMMLFYVVLRIHITGTSSVPFYQVIIATIISAIWAIFHFIISLKE